MRAAFIQALIAEAEKQKNLWLLTADLGYSFLEAFAEKFPERFLNVGVAEQNMIGVATGLALTGKKVVVYSIINFLTWRALEHIRNNLCYHELDVLLVGVGAGYFYGHQGYSHHGIEDLAIMRALPHLKIYAPINAQHTGRLTQQLLKMSGPTYLRLGRDHPSDQYPIDEYLVDQAYYLKQGKDLVLLSFGEATLHTLSVAKILEQQGLAAGVVTFPQLIPFDKAALMVVATRYPWLVVIEEHVVGGLATFVAETLMQEQMRVRVSTFQLPHVPITLGGSSKELLEMAGLGVEQIASAILREMR